MKQYNVIGRKNPTEADPEPQMYRMKIFANNPCTAKSRYWYFVHKMSGKMKKTTGQIIDCNEIAEKNPSQISNYGIWVRYDSRSNTHNLYKEYRSLTLCDAVDQMYQEMAGLHRARPRNIQIIKTATLADEDCKKTNVTQFHDASTKFPLPHRVPRAGLKKYRATFRAARPSTFKK